MFLNYIPVLQSRELEVDIYWRHYKPMVGVLFVKLENFLDCEKRLIELPVEPYGTLYCEVRRKVAIYG